MGARTGAAARIDLIRVMDLLQAHLTPALCQAAFRRVRTTERQRRWTLHALVQFWTAVTLRAPTALTQALADAVADREPLYPRIEATPEAFFQRCRDLRSVFFAEVFQRFTARLVAQVPARYAEPMAPVHARFTAIVILDGSRVAAIARRLKLLWNERAVILPGALLAVYDLGRGVCRALYFSADAAASEMTRAKAVLPDLARDTLVLGDRLYGTVDFFASTMRVDLALLHEGDLFAFLWAMRASGKAYYAVRRCAILRTGQSAAVASLAPRLRADCQIDLITIVPTSRARHSASNAARSFVSGTM